MVGINLSIVVALVLLVLGVPIAFALISSSLLGLYFVMKGNLYVLAHMVWSVGSEYVYIVIVLFVLMGEIASQGGMADRMYEALSPWLGRVRGGLLHTNIWSCAVFGAICGSSMATAGAMGVIAYPEQVKRGYSKMRVLGSLAAGGTLGILIPPSTVAIMYCILTETSILKVYLAGFIPGIILAALFSLYIIGADSIKPWHLPEAKTKVSWKRKVILLGGLIPVLFIVIGVLAVMYLGIATPSEAAAVGSILILIVCLALRQLPWSKLWHALVSTTQIATMAIIILIGGMLWSSLLINTGVNFMLLDFIEAHELSPYVVFGVMCSIYFILGCFLDSFSILVICTPVFFPVMVALGFDAVWLGIIIIILIETGLITPPYGINLYVLDAISGRKLLGQIMIGAAPYVLLEILALILFLFFPQIVLFLPNTM